MSITSKMLKYIAPEKKENLEVEIPSLKQLNNKLMA